METTKETTEKSAKSTVRMPDAAPVRATPCTVRHLAFDFLARLTSRKLWMVIVSCSIPWLGLERGVNHLYALQPSQAAVYGGMFLCVMGGIVAIVCKYMGVNVSVSAATNVTGAISAAAQNIFERKEQQTEMHIVDEQIVRTMEEKYRDDPSYRPLDTLPKEGA